LFVLLAMLVEAASLLWIGPGAFLSYLFGAGILFLVGVVTFLASLLRGSAEPAPAAD
jgi:hypothetical protein